MDKGITELHTPDNPVLGSSAHKISKNYDWPGTLYSFQLSERDPVTFGPSRYSTERAPIVMKESCSSIIKVNNQIVIVAKRAISTFKALT